MRVRPFGPEAWIVDELDEPSAWAEALRAERVDGIRDIVPAESSVVVRCTRSLAPSIGTHLSARPAAARSSDQRADVVIDVVYDGADLAEVAERNHADVDDVVAWHSQATYTVAFCGFSPGFAYLTGVDERLRLPRRERPRTVVPAGSVAIAAGYSAVYPSASPGGWHLLGHTDAIVWDPHRDRPALLVPGTRVRFRAVAP